MNSFDNTTILTISEITRAIKNNLEKQYRFIRVCGEISNLSTPYSGHSYFVLKDDTAQIRGVLFKQQKRFVDLSLANGQQVICFGRITVYEPRGEYQLVIDSIQLEGEGQLQLAFENLKKKLQGKGYFDNDRKKSLPQFPEKIAIITSPTGAAIQDFLKIDTLRNSKVHIQILPVRVQGTQAASEIRDALRLANKLDDIDIIVLCRGGGSLEDLWAFNEEKVAKAIYDSKVPVVTGIGHEVDFTIADFCSDFRCPTPTGAAEKIIYNTNILTGELASLRNRLQRSIHHSYSSLGQKLLHHKLQLKSFTRRFDNESFRLQMSKSYITSAMSNALKQKADTLTLLSNRLYAQAPNHQIELQSHQVNFLLQQLKERMARIIDQKEAALIHGAKLLNSVSPLATLERGYSITRKVSETNDGYQVITDTDQAEIGDRVNILLHRGELECEVKKKNTM